MQPNRSAIIRHDQDVALPTADSRALGSFERPVRIAGAGPAGLSAAITLARAGFPVEVHERGPRPGCRHHFDYQAIENWSSNEDALERIDRLGLDLDLPSYPIHELCLMRGKGPFMRTSTERPLT